MSMEELGQNGERSISMDTDEYAKFQLWIADTKKRNIADKIKDMKEKAALRRQTLVWRRVDHKSIAPDEDVAAYGEIFKLKNPSGEAKNKTFVSDNEILAYKELDPRFDSCPTLTEISAKIETMKASGALSAKGDVTDPET